MVGRRGWVCHSVSAPRGSLQQYFLPGLSRTPLPPRATVRQLLGACAVYQRRSTPQTKQAAYPRVLGFWIFPVLETPLGVPLSTSLPVVLYGMRGYLEHARSPQSPSLLCDCLHLACQGAVRNDGYFKSIFQRHRDNGKSYKEAIVVVMNRFIHVLYAIWRDNRPYSPLTPA